MKCINFGKVDRKFLIPIFGGIVNLAYRYIIRLIPKGENLMENPFIINIYVSIGMILAFIPYLILKYRTKNIVVQYVHYNEKQEDSKLNIKLIHNKNIEEKKRFTKYLLFFLSASFGFLQTLLLNLFCSNCIYNLWIFDIIFISLFSYLILKTKLYKHQYISMGIIISLGFCLNIIEYFKLNEEKQLYPFEIIMKLISEICLSLTMVIIKYNIEKYFLSPYQVAIWQGALELVLNIICLVTINLFGAVIEDIEYPDNFLDYFRNYNIYDFIMSFILILVGFFYNAFLFLTCNYFTPCHILISLIIKECYTYFQLQRNMFLNILGFIDLILVTFMFLIFIEIIELNIFNISYDTKKNIEIRSKLETPFDINNTIDSNEEIKEEDEEDEKSNSSA